MCEVYLQVLQDQYPKFQEMGINWVAITTDDPQKVREFRDKLKLSFPMLLDSDGKVAHQYGTFWYEKKGYPQPAVYVVRHNRKLEFQGLVSGPSARPPVSDVLRLIKWSHGQ